MLEMKVKQLTDNYEKAKVFEHNLHAFNTKLKIKKKRNNYKELQVI